MAQIAGDSHARPRSKASRVTGTAGVVLALAIGLSAQSIAVRAVNDTLHLRAPAFLFLKGEPLVRLKDGRSVRFDFEIEVRARPGTPAVARSQASFILSYDLWDERFAVTQSDPPAASASVSHLYARDAEAWCLDRLSVPLVALGGLGRSAPLWIRVSYRVAGDEEASPGDSGLTLRGLIDRLSRRTTGDVRDTIEAGPLMLTK